jgi:hypothetical protein
MGVQTQPINRAAEMKWQRAENAPVEAPFFESGRFCPMGPEAWRRHARAPRQSFRRAET